MKNITIVVMLISLFFVGCEKDNTTDPPDPNPNPEITVDSNPQFIGKINGVEVIFDPSNSVAIQGGDGSIAYYPDTSSFIYTATLGSLDYTKSYLEVDIGTLYKPGGGYPDNELFFSFIVQGSLPYSVDALDGINISYWDDSYKHWSTSLSPSGQANSTFTFVEVKNVISHVKFKASFNCTLYDSSGNSITLTDGIYVNYFSNM